MASKEYVLTLLLKGQAKLTAELEDQLFEAGCDDATLSFQWGGLRLAFMRAANSLEEAVITAIRDVESIEESVWVVSVEPSDNVSQAEIARRLQVSREYVRLLINGERGDGNFPPPISGTSAQNTHWSWIDVLHWWQSVKQIDDKPAWEEAETLRIINGLLAQRALRNSYQWERIQHSLFSESPTMVQDPKPQNHKP